MIQMEIESSIRISKTPTKDVIILSTGCYGDLLAMFFREDETIPRSQKSVRVLNPTQVGQFKKAYSDIPKTDDVDAFVIADSLRFGRFGQKGTVMEDKYIALQKITRAHLKRTAIYKACLLNFQ